MQYHSGTEEIRFNDFCVFWYFQCLKKKNIKRENVWDTFENDMDVFILDCDNSIANALLLQSCIKPSKL